jgi:hypothetical protein
MHIILPEEEFEDTKRIIRIRKSKKDKQHDGQKKKDKRTHNLRQNVNKHITFLKQRWLLCQMCTRSQV